MTDVDRTARRTTVTACPDGPLLLRGDYEVVDAAQIGRASCRERVLRLV